MFWPGQLGTGLGIELAAVLMLGAIAAMYVVAVLAVAGGQAVVAAAFVTAVAVGSWLRSAEIVRTNSPSTAISSCTQYGEPGACAVVMSAPQDTDRRRPGSVG
ncbi:hypothetical protein ONA70_20390 [Micromonospora yasonensis]|uniref:hypothetical protein n=1 Tax=Micromonospora yasonensis TaxID=1128667 RepID=UPI00222E6167|nr:hypothetical protein [Micromonospora yasonensis]MCW3842461.1 hypothetical protein [Micromonospora yasonensis]